MGEEKPPILEYRTPIPASRRSVDFAGCLVPLAIVIFGLGALVIYEGTGQVGRDRRDYYARGIGIVLVAIAALVLNFIVRKRNR